MNKIKGVFALTLAAALALCGCDGSNNPDKSTDTASMPPVTVVEKTLPNGSQTEEAPTAILTENTFQTISDASQTTSLPDNISSDIGSQISSSAEMLLGIPFAENGASPSVGFDNSGFIYYVLRENGFINCPRLTNEQAKMGFVIGYDELRKGDLAFFATDESGNPDFGGIYIGDSRMIYSPMPGQTVKIVDLSPDYWRRTFVSGVRLS